MYIVRDLNSKQIVHINPAPLELNLATEDIYYQFNAATMEIGRTEQDDIPENFEIDATGLIIKTGAEDSRAEPTADPPLTLAGQIAAGLITLSPYEKLTGEDYDAQIVYKTLSEQVADGLVILEPNQKITGSGDEETIEFKTVQELLQEKLITPDDIPNLIETGQTTLSLEDLFNEATITFNEYQALKIREFSDLALRIRCSFLPDYQIQNALLGIYDAATTAQIKATVEVFRNEFYRLKALVEQAPSLAEVLTIKENYPREILILNNGE